MFDQQMARKAAETLGRVRREKPLIHNITNYVVMNYTANALLACGASPVMAHAPDEVEEMVSLSRALVLNIGAPAPHFLDSMLKAGKRANELKIPIVFDPVGAGATSLRTGSAKRLIHDLKISVVRGNASEVLSLTDEAYRPKGVDSAHSMEEAVGAAVKLAGELRLTVVITGEVDLVTDGERICRIFNGHALMRYVTGAGCTATALIGAFLAVNKDSVEAASMALAYFGLSGEKAASRATTPGSFQIALLDALYTTDERELLAGARIQT